MVAQCEICRVVVSSLFRLLHKRSIEDFSDLSGSVEYLDTAECIIYIFTEINYIKIYRFSITTRKKNTKFKGNSEGPAITMLRDKDEVRNRCYNRC